MQSLGFKVGGTSANQTWTYSNPFFENSNLKSRLGIDVALFLNAFKSKGICLLLEMHYLQKGFKEQFLVSSEESPDGTGEFFELKPRIDYLSFPILAKLQLPMHLSPYIVVGPRIDVRLGQKADGYQAVYDHLNRLDLGASIGMGVETPELLSFNFLVEFRYSPSFTDVFESDTLTLKNKSFEFLVGIGFRFKVPANLSHNSPTRAWHQDEEPDCLRDNSNNACTRRRGAVFLE